MVPADNQADSDMHETLKNELIERAEKDQALLKSLKDAGELMDDAYHPKLKALHEENTKRAKDILRTAGWPTIRQVGEEGSDAMWLIVQHSVQDPEFMLSCVTALKALVAKGQAKGWQLAFLEDRARMLTGKPQIYGTQHILDGNGELVPYRIVQPEEVDERRKELGLEPLAERTALLRADHQKVKLARARRNKQDSSSAQFARHADVLSEP
jgi:hypothetical protein